MTAVSASTGARSVAICARNESELDRAKADLTSRGITVHTFVCDVTDRDAVEAMVAIGYPGKLEDLPEKYLGRETPNGRRPVSESVFEGSLPR